MSSQTMQAVTEHGSVEYEVVECDSCGMDTAKESAQRFYIGEVKETDSYNSLNKTVVKFKKNTVNKGWACQHCHDGDVAGLPSDSPTSSGTTDGVVQFVVSGLVSIALFPKEPIKKELKNNGFDNMDANFLSSVSVFLWIFFVSIFAMYVVSSASIVLYYL